MAELGRAARRPFGDAADLVLATMACHGSIRAGDIVAREEAVALLRALDDIDFAGHCPHGRPTASELLDAVREFLTGQVMPATTGQLAFHARSKYGIASTALPRFISNSVPGFQVPESRSPVTNFRPPQF